MFIIGLKKEQQLHQKYNSILAWIILGLFAASVAVNWVAHSVRADVRSRLNDDQYMCAFHLAFQVASAARQYKMFSSHFDVAKMHVDEIRFVLQKSKDGSGDLFLDVCKGGGSDFPSFMYIGY